MPFGPSWRNAVASRVALLITPRRARQAVGVEVLAAVTRAVPCIQSIDGIRIGFRAGCPGSIGTSVARTVLERERIVQVPVSSMHVPTHPITSVGALVSLVYTMAFCNPVLLPQHPLKHMVTMERKNHIAPSLSNQFYGRVVGACRDTYNIYLPERYDDRLGQQMGV